MPDDKKWKIKIDEESKAPAFQPPEKEGDLQRLIFISPEGKEVALDAPGMYEKIIEMGKSEKELRGNVKRLEGQLELFSDIDDIAEWKENATKALETVANFNDKEWMDVKKVEKLKEEMKSAHEKQVQQIQNSFGEQAKKTEETLKKKDVQIRKLMVSNKFATHPLFSGKERKTTLPPEIAETYFGKNFNVEEQDNGELVLRAYYNNGDPVYSHENPGELADFHEAMFSIFEKYPGKESLMISSGGGSGSQGGAGGKDDDKDDDLHKLEEQYAKAKEAKDVKTMTRLNNQIFKLRQQKRAAA